MEWYPTPSYLVKRRVILECLSTLEGRNILEVGCGCGDLLRVLEQKGYVGLGIDLSMDALAVADVGLSGNGIKVSCCTPDDIDEYFDIVIASEVLEHCRDDAGFLSQLGERLSAGGHLLLTVPAHMKDWGANDDLCGHIRRYERDGLSSLLMDNGFDEIEIVSYGVPVYNVMMPVYNLAVRQKASIAAEPMEKTAESGGMPLMKNSGWLFRTAFNDVTMYPFYVLQRMFYHTDLGKGFFAVARKKGCDK